MNLKKIELFGFKSFMRKLDFHFSDGITVIVGPNGCGKTNVTDALRWVLGETNARMLRGSRMEDLIFNGAGAYKPLNVAEVSLSIDNSSGILPTEYTEVTVTRRVLRNGESEFLLNKIPCRLKDITELLMDTGLGSRAYSIIERDMVEMVLSDQPEKRRELLEEAAGISKYKTRERQARRKLEATDEDLQRITDILAEVERQVRSLKRQVGAARRYQEVRDRLKGLEVSLAACDLSSIHKERASLDEGVAEHRTERDGAQARIAAMEASIEELRLKSADAETRLSGIQSEVDELAEAARDAESNNRVRKERRDAFSGSARRLASEKEDLTRSIQDGTERAEELHSEREQRSTDLEGLEGELKEARESLDRVESDLGERRSALESAREASAGAAKTLSDHVSELSGMVAHGAHLADRDAALSAEADSLRRALEARREDARSEADRSEQSRTEWERLEERAAECRRRMETLEEKRENIREEESAHSLEAQAAQSALEMLRGLHESFEGYGKGAQSLLANGGSERLTALADSLRVPREDLIPAIDSALESAAHCLVAPDSGAAVEAVRSLKAGGGRATLLDLEAFRSSGNGATLPEVADSSVVGPARSFLEVSDEFTPVLDALLASAVIVETLEDAVRLSNVPAYAGLRFIARDGDWASAPGVIHGGSGEHSPGSSVLGRAGRIENLEGLVTSAGEKREDARRRAEELASERDRVRTEIEEADRLREAARQAASEAGTAVERLGASIEAAETRDTAIRAERDELAKREDGLSREREKCERIVEEARAQEKRLGDEQALRESELVASTEDRDGVRDRVHGCEVARTRVAGEREKLELEIARIEESRRSDEAGIKRRDEEIGSIDRSVGELDRKMDEGRAVHAERSRELDGRRHVRDDIARGRTGVLEELRQHEEERNRWMRLRDDATEGVHQSEMALTGLTSRESELVERIRREFETDLTLPDAIAVHGDLVRAPEEEQESARTEMEELRTQIRRMGGVNLVALDQYDREFARQEFLQTQKQDLEEAREALRRTIRKINRKARTLFMETLEEVRVHFQKTYSTLFEGGQADIRLVGEEDPLNAPIELFARPKGKKLGSISLLSSGERALTAVAFLFGIYLVKPSPFCILDEVDAPLDDMNIGRFIEMLREVAGKTQFVMITHNKKTMEVADYIYGVTMEEPGISKLVSVRLGREDADPEAERERLREIDRDGVLVEEGAA
ncbi:MAG: chromosome segregation protein SMC [Gemmatimonadota bacterium]|nr:chromosome segregation protein SMC [Gemmatimonadota bacterium]MDP6802746.1 chromosome segregation protein SMC [Gemmatimonadota bacterium]MDP7031733.1 chromosome segregation protein SMC [Gemmatimonadota bacterium]